MKKNTKRNMLIGIAILIILILGGFIIKLYYNNKNNTTNDTTSKTESKEEETLKYNTNEGVIKDKEINGITFTNITCTYDGAYSILEYTITNHSNQNINLGEYEIIVKDKNGNILANLAPTLDYELKKEESYNTGNAIDIDLSTASSIELVVNNQ